MHAPQPITDEIRQAIDRAGDQPVRLEDPQTRQTYVLLTADLYDRIQKPFANEDRDSAEAAFPGIRDVFEDWNDPAMDIYDGLDPRK
jgi:hypothetical protein